MADREITYTEADDDDKDASCGFCGCYWSWEDMEDEFLCNPCSWYGHGAGEYIKAGKPVPDLI